MLQSAGVVAERRWESVVTRTRAGSSGARWGSSGAMEEFEGIVDRSDLKKYRPAQNRSAPEHAVCTRQRLVWRSVGEVRAMASKSMALHRALTP
eukprot:5409633-Prymnesium_polylepis.1